MSWVQAPDQNSHVNAVPNSRSFVYENGCCSVPKVAHLSTWHVKRKVNVMLQLFVFIFHVCLRLQIETRWRRRRRQCRDGLVATRRIMLQARGGAPGPLSPLFGNKQQPWMLRKHLYGGGGLVVASIILRETISAQLFSRIQNETQLHPPRR